MSDELKPEGGTSLIMIFGVLWEAIGTGMLNGV